MSTRLEEAVATIEELYRAAVERAEKAEWIAEYTRTWCECWGMPFDVSAAEQRYQEAREGRPPAPRFARHLQQRERETHALREELERAREGERRALKWAQREHLATKSIRAQCRELAEQLRRLKGTPADEL